MEKKMGTIILYEGYIRIMEQKWKLLYYDRVYVYIYIFKYPRT